MRINKRTLSVLIFSALLLIVAGYMREKTSSAYTSEGAQDAGYLDRRINALEIRLGSIELSLRSLERQAMNAQQMPQSQPGRDPETSLMRSELELLKGRFREIECGLVHLDARTLSVPAREAQKRASGQSTDPCRLNPESPIQMSPRR